MRSLVFVAFVVEMIMIAVVVDVEDEDDERRVDKL